ncbi:dienelactone hydrolase family protein [Acidocella sp.]|uniref:dienelactone hydrolase family protein n=1 Tax=Acidocella sp. TaxID=50710 RepID=UPI00262CFE14|nr:dienelactone hydrolase family protein [Acidocella sp.]
MLKLTAADGHEFAAFEAGNVNAPRALVVLQEIFGVNAHMRGVAERLAGYGYHVLAPALFDRVQRGVELGYEPADMQAGIALRAPIPHEQTLLDIEATAQALGNKPLGVIGYCWGGTLSWRAACKTERFWAASCWYGSEIIKEKDLTPNCPVQLHYGAADKSSPPEVITAMRAAQPGIEIYSYDGADHGFGCEARASFSHKDWELAELRSLALFAEHLR